MTKAFRELHDSGAMMECVQTLAGKIAANFAGKKREFALVGIHQQGVPLAEKLWSELMHRGFTPKLGELDITMYRDDIGSRRLLPMIGATEILFDVNGMEIILVDDVLSSGRTIRAALDALTDYGRPAMIKLAVLVDRGEPEFPIRADYVGFNVSVPADRKIVVRFSADDEYPAGIFEVEWKKNQP